jgi:hypothetical protein
VTFGLYYILSAGHVSIENWQRIKGSPEKETKSSKREILGPGYAEHFKMYSLF